MTMEFPEGRSGGHIDSTLIRDGKDLLFPMLVRLTPEGEFTYDAQDTYEYLREHYFSDLPAFQRTGNGIEEKWVDPGELERKGAVGLEGSAFDLKVNAINLWGMRWTKQKLFGLIGIACVSFLISLLAILISIF